MAATLAELRGLVAACGRVMVDILNVFTPHLQRCIKPPAHTGEPNERCAYLPTAAVLTITESALIPTKGRQHGSILLSILMRKTLS